MKQNKPSRKPQKINEDIWYYEYPKTLSFCVWATMYKGIVNFRKCEQFKVSHRKIIASLKRAGYKISK